MVVEFLRGMWEGDKVVEVVNGAMRRRIYFFGGREI